MTAAPFDFAPLLPPGLPAPAANWTGLPKYNFTGGNNDADQVPVDGLIAAATAVLRREGRTLATYGLASGPQGYLPLREFLVAKLKRDAGIVCRPDEILITSGSLQAHRPRQRRAARARRHRADRAGVLSGLDQPADAARRQGDRHPARPRRHADGRARRRRSPISSARASGRNTSTPSRPCRTRPAPSCRKRAARNCCGLPANTACRSSRTTATPT